MTREEFNLHVNIGDIVTIVGVENRHIPCVVMSKTKFSVNLYTVEQALGDDGVVRPYASYYRTYEEIISRIGEAHGLYNYYLGLKNKFYDKFEENENEEYKQWIDKNYKFIRRFIRDCLSIDLENVHDDYYTATINISEPKEFQQ